MSFVTACVRPTRVFMSSLLNTFREHRQARLCPLSIANKSNLRWWVHFVPHYNGVSLIKSDPWINDPLFLSTDGCSTRARGYFHSTFPDHILQRHSHDINVLELLTVMVALKLWGPSLSDQCFVIHCDNNNSILTLSSGWSRSHGMQICLREIWFISAQCDFELIADHIKAALTPLQTTLAAGTSLLLIKPPLLTSNLYSNCVSSPYTGHPPTNLLADIPASPAALHQLSITVQSFVLCSRHSTEPSLSLACLFLLLRPLPVLSPSGNTRHSCIVPDLLHLQH